ncbi:MAG: hypothetical protein IJU39_07070 [Clostridia bacterium]|nr:hypothetical protein [Clostridia bacterium]
MKKGKIFTVFALLLVLAVTVSCSKKAIEDNAPTTVEEIESTTETTTTPNYSIDLSYLKLDHSLEGERSRLSEEDQKLYDKWLEKTLRLEVFYIHANSTEEVDHFCDILNAIDSDYPEIRLYASATYANDTQDVLKVYYCNNWISYYYCNNWISYSDPSIDYSFSPEILINEINLIEEKCDEVISQMPEGLDTVEKYEYLLQSLCLMTEYCEDEDIYIDEKGFKYIDNSYCYVNGPLAQGIGICQSYAYAYQLLCQRAGLWCSSNVYGYDHRWNLVKLDNGLTYHVDPTWCDFPRLEEGYINDYFLLSQEEIEEDHQPSEDSWVATGTTLQ